MTVSASDLKSKAKCDEKRKTSVHKRKMLRFKGFNTLRPFHKSKIALKKRIACRCNCGWQRGLDSASARIYSFKLSPSAGRRCDVISIKSRSKMAGNRSRKRQSSNTRKEEGPEKRPFLSSSFFDFSFSFFVESS